MAVPHEIKVPLLAVNDTSLTVVEINCSNGQRVKKGDVLMVLETSKTTYDVTAEADGYIQYFCETGKDYEVNELVAKIFTDVDDLMEVQSPQNGALNKQSAAPLAKAVTVADWTGATVFSEEAGRLISASGVTEALFAGKDFVSKTDVQEMLGLQPAQPVTDNTERAPVNKHQRTPVDNTRLVVKKLSSGKKKEITFLSAVQSTGLTSTINTFVETGGFFVQVNPSLQYLKNSLLPLLVYETARLLKKYPLLNAYYSDGEIAVYKEVNIGFAIDIDKGLKVLKLPLSNEKSLAQIEAGIMELSGKYLDDKLEVSDLTEISFTVTDLSAEGVAFFKPLINMMNSAILGVSAIDELLNRCTLSVTFDHRVTEGKQVARFLQELKERLESYRADQTYRTKEITCFKCFTPLAEDIGNVGFMACIQPDGRDGYICQRCFKGF